MRGRILAYDFRTGTGEISGDDGDRYRFVGTDWKPQAPPRSGQTVDFERDGNEARGIYTVGAAGGGSGAAGEKNKIAAGLLAIFLGNFGIHKFYIGKNGAGVAMLLISIFGIILLFIPTLIIALIAFVEGIIYLTTPDDQFEARYVDGDRSWF